MMIFCANCWRWHPNYEPHTCPKMDTMLGCGDCHMEFSSDEGYLLHVCPATIDGKPKQEESMSEEFVTKDSGQRQEFNSGMKRDVTGNKIRYDLVDMPMLKRWAELMTRGSVKYGPNNWKKAASQEELDRFKESAFRHFMTWFLEEDKTEDHGAAVFFNIAGAEMVKTKLQEK